MGRAREGRRNAGGPRVVQAEQERSPERNEHKGREEHQRGREERDTDEERADAARRRSLHRWRIVAAIRDERVRPRTTHSVTVHQTAQVLQGQASDVGLAHTGDGLDLRTYRWPTPGAVRAHVLLVHGVAEHAGRYQHVASRLASAGFETHAFDLRGFGGSSGHRAYVDGWSQYHDDLEGRLAEVRSAAGELPVVLYGHSMGGLIALGYVLADPPRPLPDLLVLSAPALDAVVPAWKRGLAGILAVAVPRFAIANTFPKGALSSDPAVESAYLADPLAVHRTTARLGVALLREQDRVRSALADRGPLPVATYVLHGAEDPLVPERASRSLDGRANVTRRVYPGLHHETHNEPSGAAVIDETIAWIARHIGADSRGATRTEGAQASPR